MNNPVNILDVMNRFDLSEKEARTLYKDIQDFIQKMRFQRKFSTVTGYLTGRSDLVPIITLGGGSYTNDREVVVGVGEMYWQLSKEELIMIIWALEIHELFHTLSSNFSRLLMYMEDQTKRLVSEGFPRRLAEHVVHSVANILEDGRIERIAARYLPGTVKYLQFLNIFHWQNGGVTGEEDQISLLLNTMLTHAKLGIYPKDYSKHALNTEADEMFQQIKHLVPKAITARTHKDNLDVCVEVIDSILPFLKSQYEEMKDEMDSMRKLQELLEDLVSSSSYNNSTESHQNTGDVHPSPTHLTSHSNSDTQVGSSDPNEGDTDNEIKGNLDGSSSSGDKGRPVGDESEIGDPIPSKDQGEKAETSSQNLSSGREETLSEGQPNTLEDLLASIRSELSNDATQEIEALDKAQEKERQLASKIERPFTMPNVYKELGRNFREMPLTHEPQHDLPRELKVKANQFKKDIQKIMQRKTQHMVYGQKKGTLNEDDLFLVGLSDYNIFTVENSKSRADHVVYILQDGSGSMHGEKEKNSAFALSIIEDGLKGVIPFKITTFKAGFGEVIHEVVKPWNGTSKKNYAFNYHKLASAGGGNEDDVSIRIATAELKIRPEKDKVLIVLSDGLPSSEEKTKMAIRLARAAGIHVVGIMFGDEHFRKRSYENYRKMYEKNIIATAPTGIPKKLIETLKNILSR